MIAEALMRAAQQAGVEPDIDRLLDALWLAGRLPQPASRSTTDGPDPRREPEPAQPKQAGPVAVRYVSRPVNPIRVKPIVRKSRTASGFACVPMRADDLRQPLAVGRALRPLRYRRPAAVATELDEAATADRSARAGGCCWLPVLRAPMRRWPDVAVLAETESNLWNSRLAEVNLVLKRLGAFRQHREWRLDPPLRDSRRATVAPGLTGDLGPERPADQLVDPTGRRLLLVLTDGASSGWSSGAYRDLFNQWSRTNPVGIISLAAPRMWPVNGMRAAARRIEVSGAWLPNRRWCATGPAYPPIPVADLTPARLASFAALFAGPTCVGARQVLALEPVRRGRQPASAPARTTPSPAAAVRRARSQLRPSVFWLLVGLAKMPLVPGPLLDRAKALIAPAATVDDLAEMTRSELLQPCVVRDRVGHSRVLGYRFRDPAVRDELALWSGDADQTMLFWDLLDFARKSAELSEDELRDLLAAPDDRDAMAQLLFHTTRIDLVGPKIEIGYRHHAIQAVQRARRVQSAHELASKLAAVGLLHTAEPEFVSATELLTPARRRDAFGRTDRLLAIDDLEALHNDHEPRRRRALDELVAAMSGPDGPIVALCGDGGHLAALYDIRPQLAGMVQTEQAGTTPADIIFTLLNGLINHYHLRWATGVRQDAWLVVSAWHAAIGGTDLYAQALAAFQQLFGRWRQRSGNDLNLPLAREDLLVFTETDVSQWLAASS